MAYEDEAFFRLAGQAEPDPDESDARSDFARDRDRIIYSTAFRRLAGKTQVVAAGEHGLFHNRLTHTLKVAQLGRRVAERLRQQYENAEGLSAGISGPDPDLVEAACLAHDLGHPPFGHVGEKTLRRVSDEVAGARFRTRATSGASAWLPTPFAQLRNVRLNQRLDDYLVRYAGFEGNAQTFRVLTYLSAREPVEGRFGLDLTRATLDAATKYPRSREQSADRDKKWGAYGGQDAARLQIVREIEPTGRNAAPCFEAQLMDWCDDVTYAVHDVVDFYRGGQIPLHRLLTVGKNGELSPDALRFLAAFWEEKARNVPFEMVLAAWTEMAQRSDIQYPWEPRARLKESAQSTTSRLITFFVDDVGWTERATGDRDDYTFGVGEPVRYSADFVIDRSPERARLKTLGTDILKELIWVFVIQRPELATQQHGHERIISGLVSAYCEDSDLLPPDRREERNEHGDDVRAAVDHVASLTEEAAIALYRRLSGVSLGRFSDIL